MKKWVILLVKVALLAAVGWMLGKKLFEAWGNVAAFHMAVDWRWGGLAVAGFCGSMVTSALVWRGIAWRMGERYGGAKLPTVPLLGAYTFSQLGKYVPGKVALLLMRIERAGRMGMSRSVCTLSTLMENAIYMISGGMAGMAAIARVTGELDERFRPYIWPVTIAMVAVLLVACHPSIFYRGVNRLLAKMNRPEVERGQRLSIRGVGLAVVGFLPCWVFGGVALWASLACVHRVELASCGWFAGAFALSVIIGMASFLPGGLGIREAVVAAALAIQLTPELGHDKAWVLASVAAGLQRVFQLIAEALLGVIGGVVTGVSPRKLATDDGG